MGYVMAMAPCFICKQTFSFHPNLVPSIKIKDGVPHEDGQREPICAICLEKGNKIRVEKGMEPIIARPGAYDAADENSVNWYDNRTLAR